jgi:hypothetical protein
MKAWRLIPIRIELRKKKKPETEEIPENKEELNPKSEGEKKSQVNEISKDSACPNQHHSVLSHLRGYVEFSS